MAWCTTFVIQRILKGKILKKTILFLIASLFISSSIYCNNPWDLWGVWNFSEIIPNKVITLSIGSYERSWDYLVFEPNFHSSGIGRIIYEGGHYKIDKVVESKDGFHILVHYEGALFNENDEIVDTYFFGEIAVHFLTDETIWLELVEGENTHPQFTTADFRGKDAILTRGRKISPVETDSPQS